MPCGNIKRKHLRVHFRRAHRFVPYHALQHLQRDAGVQHVHRVGMAERMDVTGTENVTPSAAAASTASPIQVRTVRSVISQRRAFSVLPVCLLRRSSGIFSVATIIYSSLTYWLSESGTGRGLVGHHFPGDARVPRPATGAGPGRNHSVRRSCSWRMPTLSAMPLWPGWQSWKASWWCCGRSRLNVTVRCSRSC